MVCRPHVYSREGFQPTIKGSIVYRNVRAAPHNSARSLRQDFCSNSKFRKWRNTVCISHFRNCGSGAKRRLRLADAIARCCLRNYFHSTRNEFCFHEIMSSLDFFFILSILSAVLRRPTLWIDPKFILEIDI